MNSIGRFFIVLGLVSIILGIGLIIFSRMKLPFSPGKLPGDILIQKKNFTFYLPFATSLVVSIIFSLVLYFISKIHR
jgi:hypothetical protein